MADWFLAGVEQAEWIVWADGDRRVQFHSGCDCPALDWPGGLGRKGSSAEYWVLQEGGERFVELLRGD